MIYEEYEEFYAKYLNIQKIYDDILSEREKIFNKTQAKAITYDKEKVKGGTTDNAFDTYLIELERKKIDERLTEAKSILDDRGRLLKLKEQELRASKALYDKIYVFYKLENLKVYSIAKTINYSESQIYRIIHNIEKRCEKMREKVC